MSLAEKITAQGCGCDAVEGHSGLISVEEALARIAAVATPVSGGQAVPLSEAAGRVLAEPVVALGPTPPFDNAAMDGYAISSAALLGEGPWALRVTGRVAAGHVAPDSLSGQGAIQVFTGAPVPSGADAVVMQEEVLRAGAQIVLRRKILMGENIRRAGEDMRAGDVILPAGRRLGGREIAACAAAGHGHVFVVRPVRIALLVTGDEVCAAGQSRSGAQIWDVNSPMLAAEIASPAVELIGPYVAADTREGLRGQLKALVEQADLIVTTGGISVGEEDHVKPALADLGAEIVFSGVALKPGKPVSFGKVQETYWLGLPGNPLSAFMTWQHLGSALCNALSGRRGAAPAGRLAVLSQALRHKPGRSEMRLARTVGYDGLGRESIDCAEATHSGRVAALSGMDGYIIIPAEAEGLPANAPVEFYPF